MVRKLNVRHEALALCGSLLLCAGCGDATSRTPGHDLIPTSPRAAVMAEAENNGPVDMIGYRSDIDPSALHGLSHRTAEERAKMIEVLASPTAQALRAIHHRVAKRGPIALVLVDHPMPPGVLSIVHLGAPGPLTRYYVTSISGFTDEVMMRSRGLAFVYEMRHPDDEGSVTLTLYADGRVDRVSEKLGTEIGGKYRRLGKPRADDSQSREILNQVAQMAPQDVPGVGRAKVYRFK